MEKYFDYRKVLKNFDKTIFFIYLPKGYGINARRKKDDVLFY